MSIFNWYDKSMPKHIYFSSRFTVRRAGIGCRILMAYIGVIADYWIGLLVIVGYGADVMKSG